MSVLLMAIPIALVLGALAVVAFVHAVRSGQFDDLDTPALRVLFDDTDAVRRSSVAGSGASRSTVDPGHGAHAGDVGRRGPARTPARGRARVDPSPGRRRP